MKKSFTFTKHINRTLKVGDQVYFHDGSALSCDTDTKDRELYIIYSYPELTGFPYILKSIVGTIVEINIRNRVSYTGDTGGYLQDCIVQLGSGKFRTCSQFIHLINT